MTLTDRGLSYRKSAIEGASTIGLMIVLFDTLVGDLRRASEALRNNDIEVRCRELNHAALVLSRLESWIDLKNGGEPAQTLTRFYAYLRSKMIEAAGTKSAKLLETQIEMILHVRTSWQMLDSSPPEVSQMSVEVPTERVKGVYTPAGEPEPDRIPFSESA
jgi:flagellar secretion chaperone FliS